MPTLLLMARSAVDSALNCNGCIGSCDKRVIGRARPRQIQESVKFIKIYRLPQNSMEFHLVLYISFYNSIARSIFLRFRYKMSLGRAIDKLVDRSKLIELRMKFKTEEEKRVRQAFELLSHGIPTDTKGLKQKIVYLEVLKQISALLGPPEVALCAAALGSTSVVALKDRDRVALPHELKKRRSRLKFDQIQKLSESIYVECKQLMQAEYALLTSADFASTEVSHTVATISSQCPPNRDTVSASIIDNSQAASSLEERTTVLQSCTGIVDDQNMTCESQLDDCVGMLTSIVRVVDGGRIRDHYR